METKNSLLQKAIENAKEIIRIKKLQHPPTLFSAFFNEYFENSEKQLEAEIKDICNNLKNLFFLHINDKDAPHFFKFVEENNKLFVKEYHMKQRDYWFHEYAERTIDCIEMLNYDNLQIISEEEFSEYEKYKALNKTFNAMFRIGFVEKKLADLIHNSPEDNTKIIEAKQLLKNDRKECFETFKSLVNSYIVRNNKISGCICAKIEHIDEDGYVFGTDYMDSNIITRFIMHWSEFIKTIRYTIPENELYSFFALTEKIRAKK